jgi:haloalkane dehalogenase/tRNA(adenine34) deaminase
MNVLRTPDDRFAALSGFDYAPRYVDDLDGFEDLRVHYVDEGAGDRVFLCLHGQPTWSYLYRRMIPAFVASGARVVAPDLLGFGRSDKPADDVFYTFTHHRAMLLAFIDRLDLRRITLVVQDWGGLLGLTLPLDGAARFERLLVMNTLLAIGEPPLPPGFVAWRAWVNANPDFDPGRLLKRGCPHLSDAEAAAYSAPFPDTRYKAGVRRFPDLVPDHPQADGAALSRAARQWWRESWRGPTFMAVGMQDPVLGPEVMRALRADLHGCPPPLEIADGGHFVQEWGERIAVAALAAFGDVRTPPDQPAPRPD